MIDLTHESGNGDDLQKAIAASLQETQTGILGGQVSREEQEISRYGSAGRFNVNHLNKSSLFFVRFTVYAKTCQPVRQS